MSDDNQRDIPDLIRKSWAEGSPTAWFEDLYRSAAKGDARVPWALMTPNPDIVEWLDKKQIDGSGKKALVIGAGLGDDAEELRRRGFAVTAFDVSETAIQWTRDRFADSPVDYVVADLLNPPEAWQGAFDFVLESRTVQSLPYQLHEQAIANIAGFVAGTLLVLCHARNPEQPAKGIPWPLSRKELAVFEQHNLKEQTFEDYSKHGLRRFRVEYIRS